MSNTKHTEWPGDGWNESPEQIQRHVIADVLSAKNAQRTALRMRAAGMGDDFIAQAQAFRDASMRGARHNQGRLAAIAKSTT